MRDVLSIMLKRAGYAVTVSEDGEEAIAQIGKEIFDLVITDLKMPKGSGLEVLKAVKEAAPETVVRSEEHTSELQSPCNLVCRLLLEKKKTQLSECTLIMLALFTAVY